MKISLEIRKDGGHRVKFRPGLNDNRLSEKVFSLTKKLAKAVRTCQATAHTDKWDGQRWSP